ncbi:MAG TPA: DNA glycosylase [Candidatus Diapherotrites archaeon]|uniref:DNA-(apurinic or apyrimidinic site) lyase n=1 Tax=Candidatus Iainarchaeum sp. TaxID=3101447 RepID=A0A7J4KWG8_9ARCH|nr:DNA glycosylase [Candidatus Diapherotrites archaeon]
MSLQPLNLHLTMLSGQAPNFIWHFESGKFERVWEGKVVHLKQDGARLKASNKKFADFTLRSNDNYSLIYKKISTGSFMKKAVKDYDGLRLTQSELWETIVCFVLSSNRSIPIIRMNVQELMKNYGEKIDSLHEFPQAEDLVRCTEQQLRASKCGFRDKYLLGTTKKVLERGDLKFSTAQELKEFLLDCPGIGEKIAECILLYGFGETSAFPLDVWMQRAMQGVYFQGKKVRREEMLEKAEELWSDFKGFAQLYLFYEFMTKKHKW